MYIIITFISDATKRSKICNSANDIKIVSNLKADRTSITFVSNIVRTSITSVSFQNTEIDTISGLSLGYSNTL